MLFGARKVVSTFPLIPHTRGEKDRLCELLVNEAERDCGERKWCKQLPYTVPALEEQSRAWFSPGLRQEEGCAFLACPPFSGPRCCARQFPTPRKGMHKYPLNLALSLPCSGNEIWLECNRWGIKERVGNKLSSTTMLSTCWISPCNV